MLPQSGLGLEGTSAHSAGMTPHSALGKEAGRMGNIELVGNKSQGPGEDLREYSSTVRFGAGGMT